MTYINIFTEFLLNIIHYASLGGHITIDLGNGSAWHSQAII